MHRDTPEFLACTKPFIEPIGRHVRLTLTWATASATSAYLLLPAEASERFRFLSNAEIYDLKIGAIGCLPLVEAASKNLRMGGMRRGLNPMTFAVFGDMVHARLLLVYAELLHATVTWPLRTTEPLEVMVQDTRLYKRYGMLRRPSNGRVGKQY